MNTGKIVEEILKSNKSINGSAISDALRNANGILGTVGKMLKTSKGESGMGLNDALKASFMDGDKIRWGTVAGSYIGASAGYRILSGGGLYRDASGNTDLMGIPFV